MTKPLAQEEINKIISPEAQEARDKYLTDLNIARQAGINLSVSRAEYDRALAKMEKPVRDLLND